LTDEDDSDIILKMKTKLKEEEVLKRFGIEQGLKHSAKRHEVLEAFLNTEGHVDAQELYEAMRRQGKRIGYSTVWRTLKLLVWAGLAREVELGDNRVRFEHLYLHPHHDHLVCLGCGRATEFLEPRLERLQDRVAKYHHFKAQRHSLVIYGLCKECQTRKGTKE
jgi:Fur family ferric uptake transcriptional regulator